MPDVERLAAEIQGLKERLAALEDEHRELQTRDTAMSIRNAVLARYERGEAIDPCFEHIIENAIETGEIEPRPENEDGRPVVTTYKHAPQDEQPEEPISEDE